MTIPSATDLTGVPQLEKKSIPLCVPDLYERGALGSLEARVGKFKESIGRINFSDHSNPYGHGDDCELRLSATLLLDLDYPILCTCNYQVGYIT